MITVIIPTLNEIKNGYLNSIFNRLSQFSFLQVLVCDGGSTDGTCELANKYNYTVISVPDSNRAQRLNAGIEVAAHDFILLHHPRSLLEADAISYLKKNHETLNWGAFTHQFDKQHPLLAWTSWWSNHVRGDIRQIFYLDHCIFSQKKLLPVIPNVDIFEDTLLCKLLAKTGKSKRLPYTVTTSAIRFLTNGIWRQSYLNQKLKWQYYFKKDHKIMNSEYEKGLGLNNEY